MNQSLHPYTRMNDNSQFISSIKNLFYSKDESFFCGECSGDVIALSREKKERAQFFLTRETRIEREN